MSSPLRRYLSGFPREVLCIVLKVVRQRKPQGVTPDYPKVTANKIKVFKIPVVSFHCTGSERLKSGRLN